MTMHFSFALGIENEEASHRIILFLSFLRILPHLLTPALEAVAVQKVTFVLSAAEVEERYKGGIMATSSKMASVGS